MVGADSRLPLPWIEAPLRQTLASRPAHALLVHGAAGVGQFDFATTLAQAWLCEGGAGGRSAAGGPCGACASCRLVQARSHPDLLVLMPAALRESMGWDANDDADESAEGAKASKAKPSKEIKVDAVRAAVRFAQTTSARGRGKVVVVHPAERMNAVAANTLLKTLEEPPGNARFVLGCTAPDALPPTIRSRCRAVELAPPATPVALAWLEQGGVIDPRTLLAACGGQPQEALEWHRHGIDAAAWNAVPGQVSRGDWAGLAAWPLPRAIDALQKLCHDASCAAVGAPLRYFAAASLGRGTDLHRLVEWSVALKDAARHAEHPLNASLLIEALVEKGRAALTAVQRGAQGRPARSLHSRA